MDQDSIFSLNYNLKSNLLFICDEASMVANEGLGGSVYGTGRLLDDLVHFVYNGKFIFKSFAHFVGDDIIAQGQFFFTQSPQIIGGFFVGGGQGEGGEL